MKPLNKLSSLTSFGLLSSGLCFGDLVIYEPFDYVDPDLSANAQTGLGLIGNWSDSGTLVATPGLTYGDLETAGSRLTMSDDSTWAEVGATLDGLLNDGDTLWFSVLVTPHALGSNPDFGFALSTDRLNDSNNVPMSNGGSGLGFRFKSGLRATAWSGDGEGSTSPSSVGATGLTAGETYLVVGEMIFGATDTINIYLPDTELNIGDVVSTQTATVDQTAFDTVAFSNKAANPRDQVDEIRFGETYADVVSAAIADVEPRITSISAVGTNLWELTLSGTANGEYELFSSNTLNFTAGTLIENLVQGDPVDAGSVGGVGNSVLTLDENGEGKIRVTLTGSPRDFLRAEVAAP